MISNDSEPLVKVKINPPAGTIILNRPDRRNALSRVLIDEVIQALNDLHAEKRIRAIILTGAGTAFCAGMDLNEMQRTANRDEADAQQQWHDDAVQYRDLIELMMRIPKPIIAAVNGPAVAGGAGLVLASDIVVASPSAKFGFPEPRRGIVAGLVAPLLTFRTGGGVAGKLLLTADVIESDEALRLGIYHEQVAEDLVWAQANELAQSCAKNSPQAMQMTKRMLNETIGEELSTLLSAGAAVSATARTTEDAREGLEAFIEKREPDWK